ncbi:DEAD/DEAH box helicase family protein [Gelidibacter pelagius]|uniref:Type I restriction endonuclease subunit R n=1 Tax=Gelidibacter pelagius TaxID=2819985 RepID=A0ABS3SPI1_9FLAO|nr:DEAD/DEAH box helicase family protein [Gelidibacter pelagius]MBO3096818.1 type I restriction endonuclease subunit R [Gelidibacter pelagius]
MAKKKDLVIDNETEFEKHFCHQLEVFGKYRLDKNRDVFINKELCLYPNDLEEFLYNTQEEKLRQLQEQYHTKWREEFQNHFKQALATKQLFQVLQDGIEVNDLHFDLIYFKPNKESNTIQSGLYKKNRFTAIRQWTFGSEGKAQNKSLDIVLLVNGFAIVTIELKNQGTSGTIEEAIEQYLGRDLDLPIFRQPFLHIVCDNDKVKMAAAFGKPPSDSNFRDFNMDLVNVAPNEHEYPVHYLYHDILLPDSLLNFLESYLYPGKGNSWIFPRYHQQRATRNVVEDIKKQIAETGELNLNYLIQHSTGSGKSNTIVWLVQNLRNAFDGDNTIFDSVVVLTDRINLDDQISKDFQKAILTPGVAEYAEDTAALKTALEQNKKVIISTIHKFSHLKELSDQTNKRICVLIDEAHRSQEGKLHDGLTDTFQTDEEGVELVAPDKQDALIEEISRKEFPNMAFIALTATPSDKTLEHFGVAKKDENGEIILDKKGNKTWEAFDVYSMDQAIKEGYIMDVAKHIYSYNTLYELNKGVDTKKEYLPMMVRKALRQKAFQDTGIIKEKCNRMVNIFKNKSAHKIDGKAKAMVVTSSRIAACKYKLFMDEEIKKQGLNYKTIIAFSGGVDVDKLELTDDELKQLRIDDLKGSKFTEDGLNKELNPRNLKIEDLFEETDDIRFLIVANKFQTGFSESLLHTMFVDKPLRDKNAVQTLSRLNRMHPGKVDTLAIDFTNSYKQIIKAYKKYQKDVTSNKSSDPNQLHELKAALIKFEIFSEDDVTKLLELATSGDGKNMPAIAGLTFRIKSNFESNLTREKRDEFRTLLGRYLGIFKYINALFNLRDKELHQFQLFCIYLSNKLSNSGNKDLEKELRDVSVVNFSIPEVEIDPEEEDDNNSSGGSTGGHGSVTRVRVTKTVKEVIEEINLNFKSEIGEEGVAIVGEFLENVANDQILISIMLNNKNKDAEKVYNEIIKEQLTNKLVDTIMSKSPEKYGDIMTDNVLSYINRTAYNVLKNTALVA